MFCTCQILGLTTRSGKLQIAYTSHDFPLPWLSSEWGQLQSGRGRHRAIECRRCEIKAREHFRVL